MSRNRISETMEKSSVRQNINPPMPQIPFVQRPTCTIKEACNAIGLGRTKLYELIGDGMIETRQIGRRRLVHVPSLLKHLHMDQP
jgi:excisionase family DNA binding protein